MGFLRGDRRAEVVRDFDGTFARRDDVLSHSPPHFTSEGEVRIKVRAVSFNPVDYQIRKGQPESKHLRSLIRVLT